MDDLSLIFSPLNFSCVNKPIFSFLLKICSTAEPVNINLPKLDSKLLQLIKNIGNQDSYVAHAALNELCDILEMPEKQAVLRDYEEIYMQSILSQFKVSFSLKI